MPVFTPDTMIKDEDGPDCVNGPSSRLFIGLAGGLTQFGAHVETLPPGSSSSIKHWHENEDEMVYILEGEATLTEGDDETVLRRGDAATFKAGVPIGHRVTNHSQSLVRYLVVGTRADKDKITYPDHNRILHKDIGPPESDVWTDFEGGAVSTHPYMKLSSEENGSPSE